MTAGGGGEVESLPGWLSPPPVSQEGHWEHRSWLPGNFSSGPHGVGLGLYPVN